jgi:hypothetical protein
MITPDFCEEPQRLTEIEVEVTEPTRPTPVAPQYHWRDIGDSRPVQVQECPACGVAPASVEDCGQFGDPACPYFGVGSQLSAPAPVVVPVSERLPEPNAKVLAYYVNALGNGRTICAIWLPAKTQSDSDNADDFTEYDEETGTLYSPEGWYEQIENCKDLGLLKVYEGEVIYWQALPKWPARALPSSPVSTEPEKSND